MKYGAGAAPTSIPPQIAAALELRMLEAAEAFISKKGLGELVELDKVEIDGDALDHGLRWCLVGRFGKQNVQSIFDAHGFNAGTYASTITPSYIHSLAVELVKHLMATVTKLANTADVKSPPFGGITFQQLPIDKFGDTNFDTCLAAMLKNEEAALGAMGAPPDLLMKPNGDLDLSDSVAYATKSLADFKAAMMLPVTFEPGQVVATPPLPTLDPSPWSWPKTQIAIEKSMEPSDFTNKDPNVMVNQVYSMLTIGVHAGLAWYYEKDYEKFASIESCIVEYLPELALFQARFTYDIAGNLWHRGVVCSPASGIVANAAQLAFHEVQFLRYQVAKAYKKKGLSIKPELKP